MSQLLRKWIADAAVDSTKIDSSDFYTFRGFQTTEDATVNGDLVVSGHTTLLDMSTSGNLIVGSQLTVDGQTFLNDVVHALDTTISNGLVQIGKDLTTAGNIAVGGSIAVTAPSILSSLTVTGTSSLRDATLSSGIVAAGDSTFSNGVRINNSLTAPKLNGDSTTNGGFRVTNSLTAPTLNGDSTIIGGFHANNNLSAPTMSTTTLTAPTFSGDSTITGGFRVTNSLTAPTMNGDTTTNGGFRVTQSLTAPKINGDSTINGGLQISNSLTAPRFNGDTTISGGFNIVNSLTAPTLNGDMTCLGGVKVNNTLTANSLSLSSITVPTINGDTTVTGGLKINNSLTAPTLIGDTTTSGGISVGHRLTSGDIYSFGYVYTNSISKANLSIPVTIYGDATITSLEAGTGGLSIANSLTVNNGKTNLGDTTVAGLKVNNSLTAPRINSDTTVFNSLGLAGQGFIRGESSTVRYAANANNVLICETSGTSGADAYFRATGGTAGVDNYNRAYLTSNYGLTWIEAQNSRLNLKASTNIDATAGGNLSLRGANVNLNPIDALNITAVATYMTNSSLGIGLTVAGGDSSFASDVYTIPYTDWSSGANVQGFDSLITCELFYKKLGRTVQLWYNILGLSAAGASGLTFTFDLPIIPWTSGISTYNFLTEIEDNNTPGAGQATFTNASTTCTLLPNTTSAFGSWTQSGIKAATGYICYESDIAGP